MQLSEFSGINMAATAKMLAAAISLLIFFANLHFLNDEEAFAPAHISAESSSSSVMFNTVAAMALPFFSGILHLAAIRYVI
ncbi:hypothetical protein SLA2020_480930 [Shorea laevis]